MKISLRLAKPDDVDAIAEIEKQSFSVPWSRELITEELLFPLSLNIVAVSSCKVVGYVLSWLIPPEVHILNIAISPEFRNKGIGKRIMEKLFQVAMERGASKFTLEVRSCNINAIIFYQRFGFVTKGIRRNYYQDTGEDALIMWKEI